jgi:anti-sigma B factor antagonist
MLPNRRQASRRSSWTAQGTECHAAAIVRADSGLVAVERPKPEQSARAVLAVTVARHEPTHSNVKVTGELDLAVVPFLTDVMNRELAAGSRHLLVDVSELTYCSCAGLGALLATRHRFTSAGGTLTLTGLEGYLGRLMRLTDHLEHRSGRPAGPAERDRSQSAPQAARAARGSDSPRGATPAPEPLARQKSSMPPQSARNGVSQTRGHQRGELPTARERYDNAGPDVYWVAPTSRPTVVNLLHAPENVTTQGDRKARARHGIPADERRLRVPSQRPM